MKIRVEVNGLRGDAPREHIIINGLEELDAVGKFVARKAKQMLRDAPLARIRHRVELTVTASIAERATAKD